MIHEIQTSCRQHLFTNGNLHTSISRTENTQSRIPIIEQSQLQNRHRTQKGKIFEKLRRIFHGREHFAYIAPGAHILTIFQTHEWEICTAKTIATDRKRTTVGWVGKKLISIVLRETGGRWKLFTWSALLRGVQQRSVRLDYPNSYIPSHVCLCVCVCVCK